MTTIHTLQTLVEIAVCAALILGLLNEKRVAIWERRIFGKIKRMFAHRKICTKKE